MKRVDSKFLFISLLGLIVAGCAGTKISNEKISDPMPGAPSMIYVHNFDLGAAKIKSDPGTLTGRPRLIHFGETDPAKKLEELSNLLANTIVEDLQKEKLPAQRISADATTPTGGWLVRGAFLEVGEGNRLQSSVLGFGAGSSDANLYITVADLSKPAGSQDLLDLNVKSSGDSLPGGAAPATITHTPIGMAAKFALNGDATEADIKRAAQTIATEMAKLVKHYADEKK